MIKKKWKETTYRPIDVAPKRIKETIKGRGRGGNQEWA
jgi:hypothetical protein